MTSLAIILQGITAANHLSVLRQRLQAEKGGKVLLSVAFVSEAGVALLEPQLSAIASQATVYCGIRNEITSRQALERLLAIGVTLYVVDTGSRQIVFHPKIYLIAGPTSATLVLGSANLTVGGLAANVEAGLVVEFSPSNPEDAMLLKHIFDTFESLHGLHPKNVLQVTSVGMIEEMQQAGRLVDESIIVSSPAVSKTSGLETDLVPRIKLTTNWPKGSYVVGKSLGPIPKGNASSVVAENMAAVVPPFGLERVWVSKSLTERDLTIPSGTNTHQTGSINLDKGQLDAAVDHRHYFRDAVFAMLNWQTTNSASVDEAFAKFELVLRGISHGDYDLAIRHTTSTTSAAYKQHNAMTRLLWGPIRPLIARRELIGASLQLYKDLAVPSRFVITID